ncbi:MAG: MobF family relaxase [Pseudonocardiaceae bacterium]
MLSIKTGHDVAYLTGPVAGGREGYYTGAVDCGEPAGLWYGAGAQTLGLTGEVDAELMETIYSHLLDPRDPATHSPATRDEAPLLGKAHRTYRNADQVYAELLKAHPDAGPEQRSTLRTQAERAARQAVSFFDATFSPTKSVTVLGIAFERMANDARAAGDVQAAAAWSAHHKAVEDAVLAGARAAIDYLQDQAGYSRVGKHGGGAGRWIDAHQFVVAQFLQHDSRNHDPQLHVHQAILNRVPCADGTWRTLDGTALHLHKSAAGAIGERVMEAHLTRSLGVRFATNPDGLARDVLGVDRAVMDMFSTRRHQITHKTAELITAHVARFGREPSALERTHLSLQATLGTRAAKLSDAETLAERLDRWEAQTRTKLVGGLSQVARDVLALAQHADPAARWSPRDVMLRALDAAGQAKQAWTRSDLIRHISNALPGHLAITPEQVRPLLDGLVDAAKELAVSVRGEETTEHLPADRQLDNGASSFARPGSATFATPGQIAAEQQLRRAAVQRGAFSFTAADADEVVARYAAAGCPLGDDQAAAVRGVMTSGAYVETLSAAAGTGKSFTVGALACAWRGANRRAFGLATSQAATQVLADEGLNALNITRWLRAQQRLATVTGITPDDQWRQQPGDLVVVDEASMSDTAALLAISRRCESAGAKLLLVGDPHQLAAVGAGGTLADLAANGVRYELVDVHRFTADWERSASLRLRQGDTEVLHEYTKHGRIIDAGAAEQAEAQAARGWLADTLVNRESVVLVPTNDAAARVSASLRAELVSLGTVPEHGVPLTREGTVAGVGDLIQARRNGWHLIGHQGNTAAPINRRCYRVTETRDDGSLVVTSADDPSVTLTLPPDYVAEHLTLGYASTVHAAQGRTLDTAHAVIDGHTDPAGAYVALTRGRDRNTAYCVTCSVPTDAQPGEVNLIEETTGRTVLAEILTRGTAQTDSDASALEQTRLAEEAARSAKVSIDRLSLEVEAWTAARTSAALDQLTADGVLSELHRTRLAADEAMGSVHRLLRTAELAGHDPATVLTNALQSGSLDSARSPAQVLHGRISNKLQDKLAPQLTGHWDLIPADVPAERRSWLESLAESADQRRWELGARIAEAPPQWALEILGPVPRDVVGREEWEGRAGWAAMYRELSDHDDAGDAIGAAPPAGLAEHRALWRTAHTALGLSEPSDAEDDMSEGALRARVRAYEREQEWAPRWVGDELGAVERAAERARTDAEVFNARAVVTEDAAEQQRLQDAAADSRHEAQELAERAAMLEKADQARGSWYAATAATRDAADRARAELAARGVALDDPLDVMTAQEWLAAHLQDQASDELTRPLRDEAELQDPAHVADQAALDADTRDAEFARHLETAIPDVRDTSVREATEDVDAEDRHRIPSADQTAAAVHRAQVALAEIEARRQYDEARAAEDADRAEQLNRWAEDDHTTERATEDTRSADNELMLER